MAPEKGRYLETPFSEKRRSGGSVLLAGGGDSEGVGQGAVIYKWCDC